MGVGKGAVRGHDLVRKWDECQIEVVICLSISSPPPPFPKISVALLVSPVVYLLFHRICHKEMHIMSLIKQQCCT